MFTDPESRMWLRNSVSVCETEEASTPIRATGNDQAMVVDESRREQGTTLIELIVFIVIVSVSIAGIMKVLSLTTGHSSDTLLRKQALAIAESLLEEVELMPLTICDPDDPNAASAVTAGDCTGGANGSNDESKLPLGPETAASVGGAEGRYASPRFDNVSDYNGFAMVSGAGIKDITNNAVAGLSGYSAGVVVQQSAFDIVPAAASLLITVTVTAPDGSKVVLDGYRTRYAPNDF